MRVASFSVVLTTAAMTCAVSAFPAGPPVSTAASASGATGGQDGGVIGVEHKGDATVYDVHTGKPVKCGTNPKPGELSAALALPIWERLGDVSCHHMIEVTSANGTKTKVKLLDGCEGCKEDDIDFPYETFPLFFNGETDGRKNGAQGVSWKIIS